MDSFWVFLWVAYHVAVFAYFNYRLDDEERMRQRREQARRERLLALGFRPPGRLPPKKEGSFLA